MNDLVKIPEDLKEEYVEMRDCALRDSAEHYKDRCLRLIERIAQQDAQIEKLKQATEIYRSAHKDCKDLTGHPEALKSQAKDWRCDACKIADEYRTPPRTDQQLQPKGEQG
jgi:DNA primase